jgi:DNA mismatch endonuclease, patch repair protein
MAWWRTALEIYVTADEGPNVFPADIIVGSCANIFNMADRVTSEQRSRIMAAVHGANTEPELYVRRQLFAAGYRFRLHAKRLAGRPDIVLPRFRTVVFVHGCFWHGHSCARGKRPASNVEFWQAKIDGNIRRDRKNRGVLKAAGWSAVVVWQCRLESSTRALLKRLEVLNAARRP